MEMPDIVWDAPDDPTGNVQAVLENGVTLDEVRDVFADRDGVTESASGSDSLATYGHASTGRFLVVVWDRVIGEPWTIYPITARLVKHPSE